MSSSAYFSISHIAKNKYKIVIQGQSALAPGATFVRECVLQKMKELFMISSQMERWNSNLFGFVLQSLIKQTLF